MRKGVGIDLVEVRRFRKYNRTRTHVFLSKVFTVHELEYCMSYKDAAPHLAGTFAAKEAASKALGVTRFPFAELEIRRRPDGAPKVWHKGRCLAISISITHEAAFAIAIALQ